MESKLKYFHVDQSIQWVIRKARSRKYDRIRDEKMKVHTKRYQNQPTEFHEEDEIYEEDEIHEEDEIQQDG